MIKIEFKDRFMNVKGTEFCQTSLHEFATELEFCDHKSMIRIDGMNKMPIYNIKSVVFRDKFLTPSRASILKKLGISKEQDEEMQQKYK